MAPKTATLDAKVEKTLAIAGLATVEMSEPAQESTVQRIRRVSARIAKKNYMKDLMSAMIRIERGRSRSTTAS